MLVVDQRADVGVLVERIADLDLAGAFHDLGDEARRRWTTGRTAGAGDAAFAIVEEDAHQRAVRRRIEIGVGEDDVGRLAAKLDGRLDEVAGGVADYPAAGAGRAGEGNEVDAGMRGQMVANCRAIAADDVEGAGRARPLRPPARRFRKPSRR